MLRRPLTLGEERVGCLLDAVVQEPVGPLLPEHQSGPHRLPEHRVQRRLALAADQVQGGARRAVAQTGKKLQGVLGRRRQAAQLAQHEVHHIVGVALGVDALEIPAPACRGVVDGEQPFLGQGGEELDGEEGIADGLFVHQPGQRRGALRRAVQRVGNEPADIRKPERRQHNVLHPAAGAADRRQPPHQRMRRGDLVVAIGADQQQVAQLGLGRQVLEQIQCRSIEPLQIVEEQRQRMLRPGEHAEQAAEHQLEAALGVLRRQLRHRWLRADQQLELGDEVEHELAVRAQRLPQRLAPRPQLGIALAQQRPDQALERLRQRRIGDVAFVLIELAGGE